MIPTSSALSSSTCIAFPGGRGRSCCFSLSLCCGVPFVDSLLDGFMGFSSILIYSRLSHSFIPAFFETLLHAIKTREKGGGSAGLTYTPTVAPSTPVSAALCHLLLYAIPPNSRRQLSPCVSFFFSFCYVNSSWKSRLVSVPFFGCGQRTFRSTSTR